MLHRAGRPRHVPRVGVLRGLATSALPTRVGVLVPSTNTSCEGDWQAVAAQLNAAAGGGRHMTIHGARMYLTNNDMFDDPEGSMLRMNEHIASGAKALSTANVDVVAYGCTTGSFFKGPGWDEEMVATIEREAGVPGIGTSPAVVEALRHFGARTVAIATPYVEWNNARLRPYMEQMGFEVLVLEGDPVAACTGNQGINDQLPERVAEFAASIDAAAADVVFCSCTAWRSMEAAAAIEEACGKPVVTSNQATIWSALRAIGCTDVPLEGFGSLLGAHLSD